MTEEVKKEFDALLEKQQLLNAMKKSVIDEERAHNKNLTEFLSTRLGYKDGESVSLIEAVDRALKL